MKTVLLLLGPSRNLALIYRRYVLREGLPVTTLRSHGAVDTWAGKRSRSKGWSHGTWETRIRSPCDGGTSQAYGETGVYLVSELHVTSE